MARRLRDWSTLPDHIIQAISELLEERIDILCLRTVCSSFRSAIPVPPPIQCSLHLKDVYYDLSRPSRDDGVTMRLAIKRYTLYLIEPISKTPACTSTAKHDTTKAFLIKVRESDSGKLRLVDPFTSLHCQQHNHMLPKCFSPSDYRVTEIAKEYGLEFTGELQRLSFLYGRLSEKAAVSTDRGDELVLMILVYSRVHFWSSGNKNWVHVSGFGERYARDIIYHKRKFYVLMFSGCLVSVDPKTMEKKTVAVPPPPAGRSLGRKSFVKSGDDLFMVSKEEYSCGGCHVIIYKLDEEKREWDLMKDGIGDNSLFMFDRGSFFVSPEVFNLFKGNCLYLPEKDNRDFTNIYPGKGAKIFSFEDGTTEYLTDIPGYSEIFWPPPTWLTPQ